MENFLTLCTERFSARKFTDEPVSDEDLGYILEAVRLAPSAVNFQPWKFLVVKSPEARRRLCKCYKQEWIATAPVAVVCLKDKSQNWTRRYDQKPHGDIDVAIAAEHLCLAAAERGLGTCWVCNYNPALFAEQFPLPDNLEAVAIVPVGHIAPDCPRKEKARKPLDEIVEYA